MGFLPYACLTSPYRRWKYKSPACLPSEGAYCEGVLCGQTGGDEHEKQAQHNGGLSPLPTYADCISPIRKKGEAGSFMLIDPPPAITL